MNQDDERLHALLKRSLPPVDNLEPRRDLWPDLLERIGAGEQTVWFNWFDWTLAGLVAAFILAFPTLIPGLLYHL